MRTHLKLMALLILVGVCTGCGKKTPAPVELQDGRILVRTFDASLLAQKVIEQKSYLLNAIHPEYFGYYKKYDPETDTAETRLRTVYSASAAYSLLKMKQYEKSPFLNQTIVSIARFLNFMQVTAGPRKGAFHYSFDPVTKTKEQRFVVGTTSKAIYTLVGLYKETGKPEYLQSANEAASWLMKQVGASGHVSPETRFDGNQWQVSTQKSYLYAGQVLSAFSRLYEVTKEPSLYNTAERIAVSLLRDAGQKNYFMGDDFRKPNTVSTSWLMMSFIDFSKINPAEKSYEEALFKSADVLLSHQISDTSNLLRYGRFDDTDASSGNGWINEVLVEGYKLCVSRQREGCQKYLDASIKVTRWLLQNIYSAENSTHLPNPRRTLGGLIRNNAEKTVRTDAVCHSINGMVELLQIKPDLFFQVPK